MEKTTHRKCFACDVSLGFVQQMNRNVTSQEKFNPDSVSFCVELTHCVCVGSLWELWLPPTAQEQACCINWSLLLKRPEE